MDRDYLNNIAGSPYVTEGAFDRLKAQAAKGIQAGAAMMGHQIEDPRTTKIKSLWGSFIGKLYRVVSDLETTVGPMLKNNSTIQLTPTQRSLLDSFTELYNTIVPPKIKSSQLYNALKETLGDVFTRDMALNKALASNDPTKILNAYQTKVIKLYQQFINDAAKVTQLPISSIENFITKIHPQYVYKNIINSIHNIQNNSTPESSANPPAISPVPVNTATATTSSTPSPSGTTSAGGASSNPTKDTLGEIIERVIEIMLDAITSDVRSKKFMTIPDDKLKSWDAEPVTKWEDPADKSSTEELPQDENKISEEATTSEEPMANDEPEPESEDDSDSNLPPDPESKGEFIYNFHSKFNKHRDSFNIEVKPTNISLLNFEGSNGVKKHLQVIWSVRNKTENNIYVKHKSIQASPTTVTEADAQPINMDGAEITHLFKFWDHQANPRTPGNQFSIDNLLEQAHPSKKGLLNGISPNIRQKIDQLTPLLLRATYAVTSRKHMEFSSKGLNIRMLQTGTVFLVKRDGNHEEISEDDIKVYLLSDNRGTREKWLDALKKIGWFEFTGENKKTAYETPKSAQNPITLVPINAAPTQPAVPLSTAAKDAISALSKISPWNKDIPLVTKYVTQAYQSLGDSADSDAIANLALKTLKDAMKSAGTPAKPSTPTTTLPVVSPETPTSSTPPVSKEPSAPVSGPAPSSPVSDAGKQRAIRKKVEKPDSDNGSVNFDDKGTVIWTKPDGTIRKFSPKQLNSMASPRLKKALKKSNYPFEKFGVTNLNESANCLVNPYQTTNFIY